MTASSEREVN